MVHRGGEFIEGRKVLEVGGLFFDFFPEFFNGIEIGRVSWSLELGQAVSMGGQESVHGRAGMLACAILNQAKMVRRLGEHLSEESGIALAGEAPAMGLPEKLTGTERHQAKDLVGFALATGFDSRLLAFPHPGVAQGPPLGETRLIAKQDQRLLLCGDPAHGGPGCALPVQPGRLIPMIRGKARFLKRKPQLIEPLAEIVRMIGHRKMHQNQILDQDRTPAGSLIPGGFRAGLDQGLPLLSLAVGEFRRTTRWALIGKTGHPLPDKGTDILTYRLLPNR